MEIIGETGRKISDSQIMAAKTVLDLSNALVKQKKVKTKAILLENGTGDIPNVSMKRMKDIDEDVAKGRWKIIRKELKDRGLPEFGYQERWL